MMRKGLAALAFSAVVAGAGSASAADETPVVHAGPSAPARAWSAAMEAADLEALARMHGPDTVAFPPGQARLDGAAAIMADYAALFARYTVRVRTDDAHWVQSGPLVVSWGQTTLTLHPKAGGPDVVSHTRFTDAAIRSGSGWRYVVDHASVPATK